MTKHQKKMLQDSKAAAKYYSKAGNVNTLEDGYLENMLDSVQRFEPTNEAEEDMKADAVLNLKDKIAYVTGNTEKSDEELEAEAMQAEANGEEFETAPNPVDQWEDVAVKAKSEGLETEVPLKEVVEKVKSATGRTSAKGTRICPNCGISEFETLKKNKNYSFVTSTVTDNEYSRTANPQLIGTDQMGCVFCYSKQRKNKTPKEEKPKTQKISVLPITKIETQEQYDQVVAEIERLTKLRDDSDQGDQGQEEKTASPLPTIEELQEMVATPFDQLSSGVSIN